MEGTEGLKIPQNPFFDFLFIQIISIKLALYRLYDNISSSNKEIGDSSYVYT